MTKSDNKKEFTPFVSLYTSGLIREKYGACFFLARLIRISDIIMNSDKRESTVYCILVRIFFFFLNSTFYFIMILTNLIILGDLSLSISLNKDVHYQALRASVYFMPYFIRRYFLLMLSFIINKHLEIIFLVILFERKNTCFQSNRLAFIFLINSRSLFFYIRNEKCFPDSDDL